MLGSRPARRLTWIVVGVAVLGVLASAAVGVTALARRQPSNGLSVLLVPGIISVTLGQGWSVAWTRIWQEDARARQGAWSFPSPLRFFFGPLNRRLGFALLGVAFAGWLLAASSASGLTQGGPTGSGPSCPYRLDNRGDYACVSKSRYEQAGAAEQKFASGILLAFYSIHFGAALGGLRLQRAPQEDDS